MGQVVTDQAFDAYNLRMHRGLVDFINKVGDKVTQWGDNIALVMPQKEMAAIADVTRATMNKYMNLMEEKGIAEVETKRGVKGGTVVVFNADMLNFPVVDNPITSDTKEAKEIRDSVYPKMPKKEPKRRYRTKAQIAEDRALKAKQNSWVESLNDQLEEKGKVTRDFFENFENPTLAYQGYVVAQMYNAYASCYPKQLAMFAKEQGDTEQVAKYEKQAGNRRHYRVMPLRFVGTNQYYQFVKLADFCNRTNTDPLKWLSVQFKRAQFLSDKGKSKVGGVPYVNSLLSESAFDAYNREVHHEGLKNVWGKSITEGKIIVQCGQFPIINMLSMMYRDKPLKEERIDKKIKDMTRLGEYNRESFWLSCYNDIMKKDVAASDLTKEEKKAVMDFVRRSVVQYSGEGMSMTEYMMHNRIPIGYMKGYASLNKVDDNIYYCGIGNKMGVDLTDDNVKTMIDQGERVDFSIYGNAEFPLVLELGSVVLGIDMDYNALRSGIQKLGEEKIPLDSSGAFDPQAVYDDLKDKTLFVEFDRKKWGVIEYLDGRTDPDDFLEPVYKKEVDSYEIL